MIDPVAAIYDRWDAWQWGRLDVRRAELHIHLRALAEHLPPGSRVLDVGAGPGRYAIELARRGHRVTAGDLSPRQAELARERIAEAGVEGIEDVLVLDARDLGRFADGSFDAVLALGPFYHLKTEEERRRAAAEAARVLRPGGLLFAAFMPRPFWLSQALADFALQPPEAGPPAQPFLEHMEAFWDGGRLTRLKSDQLKQSWFCRLAEIEPLFAAAGLRRLRMLASSGIAAAWSQVHWQSLERHGAEAVERVLGLLAKSAEEPGVLAMSDQILFVGSKEEA